MKFALAHHWLTSYRGGERVLEQMAALYSGDIHTLVKDQRAEIPGLAGRTVHTSCLQSLPKATSLYRHLLPLHPWAIQTMQVAPDVDVLLSSDASLIKGIRTPSSIKHICYCHSPPRYLWEMSADYKKTSLAARIALDRFSPKLRNWDYEAAQRVTHFIANSQFVADRIRKYYDRDSTVIFPPVAVDAFNHERPRESFYLVISELVPYKRIDLAVSAFNRLGRRLVIIGDGPERSRLESSANPNIEFLGRRKFMDLKAHLEVAKAFIFPGIEDFGITPVEAQAAGCPVIAFRAGGALETVIDSQTGLFFDEQTDESLIAAVEAFDTGIYTPQVCKNSSLRFSAARFRREYHSFVDSKVSNDLASIKPELSVASR